MKRFAVLLIVLLSSLALANPYVTVYQGRISIGEKLAVGNYTVFPTLASNGSPYVMVLRGEEVVALAPATFGRTISLKGLEVTVGSYFDNSVFLIVSAEGRKVLTVPAKVGTEFSLSGRVFSILNVTNEYLVLSCGDVFRVPANGTAQFDGLLFLYANSSLEVYAGPEVRIPETEDYSVFVPYDSITVSGPVDVPITITSRSRNTLRVPLRIVSTPAGWDASFRESGLIVGSVILPPEGSTTVVLHVEPSGSGSVVFEVGDETFVLNVQSLGVSMNFPYSGIEVAAGTNVTVPLTFTGYGGVNLSVSAPPGWDAYVVSGNYRITSFNVEGNLGTTLVISVPRNATLGDHRVEVIVNGKPYDLTVTVYKTYLGMPGTLTVRLVDDAGSPVDGWIWVDGKNVSGPLAEFRLKPGVHEVRAGGNAFNAILRNVTVLDGETKTITLRLERKPYYFEVTLGRSSLTVSSDQPGVIPLTIKNLGSKKDTYRVSLSGLPQGWDYSLSLDSAGQDTVKEISLAPGESKTVYLILYPYFSTGHGSLRLTLTVSGYSMEREYPIDVAVSSNAQLDVIPDRDTLVLRPGGSGSIRLNLDVSGVLTNVKITVRGPSGWKLDVSPDHFSRLGSSGSVMISTSIPVYVTVSVPSSAPAGTYTLVVEITSDQLRSKSMLTVRVERGSGSTYLGVLVLVVVFGAVILMMRRVGRR
ncbi:COG1470 family protein [Thermococcus nautili]|uniref:Putative membrane protein n=1 Tax=Thermococcus nautili TaxID=195522 RepID=W8PKK4_9EURY|nr:NEW3 domain-containing protein [Thermococcus nautili]AHL22624.1 putative membrane protein [Thermococcus nautili]